MSRYFKNELPYSQKMIRQQIEKAAGKTYSKQKFHCDRDSSITYQRLKINIRADVNGEIILPKDSTETRVKIEEIAAINNSAVFDYFVIRQRPSE